jgi:hypothetical protein
MNRTVRLIAVTSYLISNLGICDPIYICGNHTPPTGPHTADSEAEARQLTDKYGCADRIVTDPSAKLSQNERAVSLGKLGASDT